MLTDQPAKGLKRSGTGANLVGQRRQAEIDALAGIALCLPVQRLMLAELLEQDRCQQVRPGPSPWRRMERRRGLADLLAGATREPLADGLDHLPLPRDHLQRVGDVLAHLHDAVGTAAGAGRGCLDHHALARQVLREGFAGWATAFEAGDRRRLRRLLGGDLVLSGRGLEFLELQLHLIDQARPTLRALAVLLPSQLGDLEPKMSDHRLGGRGHCPGLRQFDLGGLGAGLDTASAARNRAISDAASSMLHPTTGRREDL